MNKLIVGRYIPIDSAIHRLDPRTKLLGSVYFISIIFLANNWQTYLLMGLFTLLAIQFSEIGFGYFLKGIKPLLWLIVFSVALQIIFSSGGEVYFQWGPLIISEFGLLSAAKIFWRFVLLIFMSTLLTLSTAPLELTDAIEFLLRPLKIVRVPVHEISLMLSIALRFVPTLMDEATKIMNAQMARGVEFGEGNIFKRLKTMVPLMIPLFVGSFNRAEELAIAMEARGYQGGEGRTKYRLLKWGYADCVVLGLFVILTIALVVLRRW